MMCLLWHHWRDRHSRILPGHLISLKVKEVCLCSVRFSAFASFFSPFLFVCLFVWLVGWFFVCLFVFFIFFWLNLNTFVFPLCEFRLVQWSCRPWLERVPLCPHLAPQSELNLCKVQGLYARFTGYPVFAGFTAVWSVYVRGLKQYKIYIFLSFYVRDLQQYKVRMRGLLPYNTFICIKCARGFNTAL